MVRHLLDRLDGSGRVTGVGTDAEMLGHAATTVVDSRVDWRRADAALLPFEDVSIDRVCCHRGLQFFPDRPAVLAEIRRVLVPGGRVAVAVWGRIEHNPWPAALSMAVGHLVVDDAGARMAVVCELGDPDELAGLLRWAGFGDVTAVVHEHVAVHGDVSAAVAGQLAALPSGSAIGELDEERRAGLIELACDLLRDHVAVDGRLGVPSTSSLASAVAPGPGP